MDQSRAFLEYKVNLQKQAAAILERKFYKRWRRHQGKDGMPEDAEDAVPVTHLLQFLKMKDER